MVGFSILGDHFIRLHYASAEGSPTNIVLIRRHVGNLLVLSTVFGIVQQIRALMVFSFPE